MSEFLKTSELTETKAFVGSFVKEVVVKPGRAAIVYSIPTPDDSPMGGADVAEIALNGRVMNSVRHGGPGRTELSPSQKSDVLKVVDFRVSASADMMIFSDVFSS